MKKTCFVQNHLLYKISKVEVGDFLILKVTSLEGILNWKKPTTFTVILLWRILLWRNHQSRFWRSQLAATNTPYALNVDKSLPKLYSILIILTNYYPAELYKVIFTLVFSSSCVLFCQNYVASIHFGVAKKSKTSLLYLGNC